jgi:hypothetical protein
MTKEELKQMPKHTELFWRGCGASVENRKFS